MSSPPFMTQDGNVDLLSIILNSPQTWQLLSPILKVFNDIGHTIDSGLNIQNSGPISHTMTGAVHLLSMLQAHRLNANYQSDSAFAPSDTLQTLSSGKGEFIKSEQFQVANRMSTQLARISESDKAPEPIKAFANALLPIFNSDVVKGSPLNSEAFLRSMLGDIIPGLNPILDAALHPYGNRYTLGNQMLSYRASKGANERALEQLYKYEYDQSYGRDTNLDAIASGLKIHGSLYGTNFVKGGQLEGAKTDTEVVRNLLSEDNQRLLDVVKELPKEIAEAIDKLPEDKKLEAVAGAVADRVAKSRAGQVPERGTALYGLVSDVRSEQDRFESRAEQYGAEMENFSRELTAVGQTFRSLMTTQQWQAFSKQYGSTSDALAALGAQKMGERAAWHMQMGDTSRAAEITSIIGSMLSQNEISDTIGRRTQADITTLLQADGLGQSGMASTASIAAIARKSALTSAGYKLSDIDHMHTNQNMADLAKSQELALVTYAAHLAKTGADLRYSGSDPRAKAFIEFKNLVATKGAGEAMRSEAARTLLRDPQVTHAAIQDIQGLGSSALNYHTPGMYNLYADSLSAETNGILLSGLYNVESAYTSELLYTKQNVRDLLKGSHLADKDRGVSKQADDIATILTSKADVDLERLAQGRLTEEEIAKLSGPERRIAKARIARRKKIEGRMVKEYVDKQIKDKRMDADTLERYEAADSEGKLAIRKELEDAARLKLQEDISRVVDLDVMAVATTLNHRGMTPAEVYRNQIQAHKYLEKAEDARLMNQDAMVNPSAYVDMLAEGDLTGMVAKAMNYSGQTFKSNTSKHVNTLMTNIGAALGLDFNAIGKAIGETIDLFTNSSSDAKNKARPDESPESNKSTPASSDAANTGANVTITDRGANIIGEKVASAVASKLDKLLPA